MAKTVLITGCSSGIGKAAAQYFHAKGWNVAATMRKPESETELKEDDRMKLVALDVENTSSIHEAIEKVYSIFGNIDVWVNNAGYGAVGVLEAGTNEQIRRQFDVNYFGVIDCIKGILPYFRKKRAGMIINISSVGGLMVIPLYSVYNSSKFALEGLTEGLSYELKEFGIQVKLVEPGGIKTEFLGRSSDVWSADSLPDYKKFTDKVMGMYKSPEMSKNFSSPKLVAEVIYRAATDGKDDLRYLAGKDAEQFWFIRRWFGYKMQMSGLRSFFKL